MEGVAGLAPRLRPPVQLADPVPGLERWQPAEQVRLLPLGLELHAKPLGCALEAVGAGLYAGDITASVRRGRHVLPAVSEDEKDEPRHQKYQHDRGDSDPRQP